MQACQEVQDCTLLAEILKVSLLVGNFLNAGNRNGAAAGFQIDALLKLKDVKSTRSRCIVLCPRLLSLGAGMFGWLAYRPLQVDSVVHVAEAAHCSTS